MSKNLNIYFFIHNLETIQIRIESRPIIQNTQIGVTKPKSYQIYINSVKVKIIAPFACRVFSHAFLLSADVFSKSTFSKKFFQKYNWGAK